MFPGEESRWCQEGAAGQSPGGHQEEGVELNELRLWVMPMEESWLRRMVWEMVSKAALRLRVMIATKPESAAMEGLKLLHHSQA